MSPVADKSPLVNLMPTLLPATTPLAVAVTVIVVPVWEYVPARAGSVWTLPFSDKSASRLPPAPKPNVTFKLPLLRFLPAFMPRPVFALPRLTSRQDAPNAVMLDVVTGYWFSIIPLRPIGPRTAATRTEELRGGNECVRTC